MRAKDVVDCTLVISLCGSAKQRAANQSLAGLSGGPWWQSHQHVLPCLAIVAMSQAARLPGIPTPAHAIALWSRLHNSIQGSRGVCRLHRSMVHRSKVWPAIETTNQRSYSNSCSSRAQCSGWAYLHTPYSYACTKGCCPARDHRRQGNITGQTTDACKFLLLPQWPRE